LSMVDLYSSDDSGFAEVFRAFEEWVVLCILYFFVLKKVCKVEYWLESQDICFNLSVDDYLALSFNLVLALLIMGMGISQCSWELLQLSTARRNIVPNLSAWFSSGGCTLGILMQELWVGAALVSFGTFTAEQKAATKEYGVALYSWQEFIELVSISY
jgi:hypothetical protein